MIASRRPNATPLLEPQIVVCFGPAQDQIAGFPLVDQAPVWFHVTIRPIFPLASQAMISVVHVQGTMVAQRFDDRAELVHVLATPLLTLHALPELGGRLRYEWSRRR